jgi:hypothetical protein
MSLTSPRPYLPRFEYPCWTTFFASAMPSKKPIQRYRESIFLIGPVVVKEKINWGGRAVVHVASRRRRRAHPLPRGCIPTNSPRSPALSSLLEAHDQWSLAVPDLERQLDSAELCASAGLLEARLNRVGPDDEVRGLPDPQAAANQSRRQRVEEELAPPRGEARRGRLPGEIEVHLLLGGKSGGEFHFHRHLQQLPRLFHLELTEIQVRRRYISTGASPTEDSHWRYRSMIAVSKGSERSLGTCSSTALTLVSRVRV